MCKKYILPMLLITISAQVNAVGFFGWFSKEKPKEKTTTEKIFSYFSSEKCKNESPKSSASWMAYLEKSVQEKKEAAKKLKDTYGIMVYGPSF